MIQDAYSLRNLSNTDLFIRAKENVKAETKATLLVLHTLREIERRRAFAEKSYPSLFEFCVEFLGYKKGAAYRRILAMRALKDLPEIEEKIQSGSLSLMTLAQAQGYFKEQACEKKPLATAQKLEILKDLENKSSRDTENYFLKLSPNPKGKETLKPVDVDNFQWQVSLPRRIKDKIDKFRSLLGPDGNGLEKIEVIERGLDLAIKEKMREQVELSRRDSTAAAAKAGRKSQVANSSSFDSDSNLNSVPTLGLGQSLKTKVPTLEQNSNSFAHSRFTSISIKRLVWQRDQSQCSFVDPTTGLRCPQKTSLQIDHIIPFAYGGKSDLDNLRLACRSHNQYFAVQALGIAKMDQYLNRRSPK